MTFEQAKARYVHRYTMEHMPSWAHFPTVGLGAYQSRYYAPQYRSDQEWFDNTTFPPENPLHKSDCWSRNQTWPLGQWLPGPFVKETK